MSRVPDGFRERHVHAQDGLRLYVRDYGPSFGGRTPVLCLAGLTRNGSDFHEVALRLAPQRRVICPDYRGRGRSARDRTWRHYAPPTLLADQMALLTALNLHRVVVIGTSLGGLLAMALAVARPTAVAGCVLNDIGPELPTTALSPLLRQLRRDRPQPNWEAAARYLRENFPGMVRDTPDAWRRAARGTFRPAPDGLLHFDWDVPGVARMLRHGGTDLPHGWSDLWPLFRALGTRPVLVVRGALSPILSQEGLARLAAARPDLWQITVPGVGHAPSLDEPECRTLLDAFLNDHDL